MKKSLKPIIALVVVSCLTSFLSSERRPDRKTLSIEKPLIDTHTYEKLKCDSLELEHRFNSMNLILATQ